MGTLFGAFAIPNSPWISPQFSADVSQSSLDDFQNYFITIENIGWAQAKNADAFIKVEGKSSIDISRCYEGHLEQSSIKNTYKINFDRMTTDVQCKILVSGDPDSKLNELTIVAEQSKGYEWNTKIIQLDEPRDIISEINYFVNSDANKLYIAIILIMAFIALGASLLLISRFTESKK